SSAWPPAQLVCRSDQKLPLWRKLVVQTEPFRFIFELHQETCSWRPGPVRFANGLDDALELSAHSVVHGRWASLHGDGRSTHRERKTTCTGTCSSSKRPPWPPHSGLSPPAR